MHIAQIYTYEIRILFRKVGESNCSMFLTKDYRFVYGFYYGQITMFRVTNISSKPIEWRERKIEQYKKIQEKINELKNQQRRLLTENI